MCEFFSCIVTRKGDLFFCEDNSHEEIIQRAKLRDTDAHVRHWVRVEVMPQGAGWGPVRVDETTTPAWWTEDAPAWEGKVLDLARRVRPAREAYEAVERQAREAYEAHISTFTGLRCGQVAMYPHDLLLLASCACLLVALAAGLKGWGWL